jgi:hypothetical protein
MYSLRWNYALSVKKKQTNRPKHKPLLLKKNHVVDCRITVQLVANKTEARQ